MRRRESNLHQMIDIPVACVCLFVPVVDKSALRAHLHAHPTCSRACAYICMYIICVQTRFTRADNACVSLLASESRSERTLMKASRFSSAHRNVRRRRRRHLRQPQQSENLSCVCVCVCLSTRSRQTNHLRTKPKTPDCVNGTNERATLYILAQKEQRLARIK